jgi:hypothetical protein
MIMAEPPTAPRATNRCWMVARLIVRRYGLARGLQARSLFALSHQATLVTLVPSYGVAHQDTKSYEPCGSAITYPRFFAYSNTSIRERQ